MRTLEVRLSSSPRDERTVGRLAQSDGRVFYEWDTAYLDGGVELSPFKLPLQAGLQEHTDLAFGPLPGLFEDSLPDGWGRLLMDRHFRRQRLDLASVSPLDRLAYLGTRTMGALTYHPALDSKSPDAPLDLFELGRHAQDVLEGDASDVLPELMRAGGSPGGARPKVVIGLRDDEVYSGTGDLPDGFEHWLVKFAARSDASYAGPVEHAYSLMANAAGVEMPKTRLFEVGAGPAMRRYFGVRRFDRGAGGRRLHVQTVASLVHTDFRTPNFDYDNLLKVTRLLTRNHQDVLRAFRQMVLNVATHVRDDHTKNFAFMVTGDDEWTLSPAYDLTFGEGPGGEHTMSVAGEGKAPTRQHCLRVGAAHGIRSAESAAVFDEVNAAVSRWGEFSEEACCPRAEAQRLGKLLRPL